MPSDTRTTTDHEEIRRWVEDHGGRPVTVKGTQTGDQAGVLRIDFPGGAGGAQLEPITWDDWFTSSRTTGLPSCTSKGRRAAKTAPSSSW